MNDTGSWSVLFLTLKSWFILTLFVMKSPADYLINHVFEARRPRRDVQSVVALADATRAIEQALADAEKYKYLLMRALRRHADDLAVSAPAVRGAADETPVLPMYPATQPARQVA